MRHTRRTFLRYNTFWVLIPRLLRTAVSLNTFLADVYIKKYINLQKTQYIIYDKRWACKLYILLHAQQLYVRNLINWRSAGDILSILYSKMIVCYVHIGV